MSTFLQTDCPYGKSQMDAMLTDYKGKQYNYPSVALSDGGYVYKL